MSAAADYVELRCASSFSFLEGASNPEDLIDRAAKLGCAQLALADRNGLYGAPRFHQAARSAGIEALIGARITVCGFEDAPNSSIEPQPELLLLVESRRGYQNLCRLLTAAHRRGEKGEAWATPEELEAHTSGLHCLFRGDAQVTPNRLDRLLGLFGPFRLAVDVSRSLNRAEEAQNRRAAAIAESCGVRIVASQDVRFARPSDRPVYDVFTCLREKVTLDDAGRRLAANAERYLRSPEEMAGRFADRPAWLCASRAIAERCTFRLHDLGYRFPTFPVPQGESQNSWLRHQVEAGARFRYGAPLASRVRGQLERELRLIAKLDLAGYFLIVWDIARFARERGMLAQGRGSAANSAVCYALGITAVDPIGMELLFERFLSEERGEWPDVDIDLPSGDQREQVIQYVFDRYGEHGAAMTAVVITYRTKLAVREVGKVLGIELNTLDRLSKVLSGLGFREKFDETRALLREGGVDPDAPRIETLLRVAEGVRGLPRHLGQHSGGIVIAAGRLDEVVPIEPAAMEKRRVVQWDKDDCADLGLIKIDLLGLGMLCALENTLELVERHEKKTVDLAKLPPDDPATYAMIQRADTMGTFQIESRAQMATLPRMLPQCFYDLVVEVAIIRPGPIVGKMVHPYLNRRAGREPIEYPHPTLEPILRRTLGVPLFQEQLLRIAMAAAGFSGGEAEELRRAMGFKRSEARMQKIETRLRRGMEERGIKGEVQDTVVRGITSFALYGFPESHAASFALIAYASSYLKAHHPAAFLAGLLNAWPMGFYSPASLIQDALRHGVEVRPIDVAHSNWECTLETSVGGAETFLTKSATQPLGGGGEGVWRSSAGFVLGNSALPSFPSDAEDCLSTDPLPPASSSQSPAVRIGLRFVDGLRKDAGPAIESARAKHPFTGAADLARRADLRHDELLTLAELGALASIDSGASTRRQALWQVSALERDSRSLFAGTPPPPAASPLPEMNSVEETFADYRASGLTAGRHVMAHLRPGLRARGIHSAAELRNVRNGRYIRTAGHIIVRQRPGSAKGMCFLTLEDETGTANAVLTPDIFKRFRAPLHTAPLIEIAGLLQNIDGVIHVRVRQLEPLQTDAAASAPTSHDYH